MPAYRVYRLDGAGNIHTAEWLEAADDEDAIREAKEQGLVPAEIWERNRLVGRVQADNPE